MRVISLVAWQLTREVLDHAPFDLTASERCVLLAIAEYARAGRTWTGPQTEIARRAGLTTDGTRRVLGKLAARGLDVRVPITADRNGRPVYAVPGRSPTFTVPRLAPEGCCCPSCSRGEGGTPGTPDGEKAGRPARVGVPPGPAAVPPGTGRRAAGPGQPCRPAHPHRPSENVPLRASARDALAERLGITLPEVDALIRTCPDCGGTNRREDADGRPTRAVCHHEAVLGERARLNTWQRSGRPA